MDKFVKTVNSIIIICWALYALYMYGDLTAKQYPILFSLVFVSVFFSIVNIIEVIHSIKNR